MKKKSAVSIKNSDQSCSETSSASDSDSADESDASDSQSITADQRETTRPQRSPVIQTQPTAAPHGPGNRVETSAGTSFQNANSHPASSAIEAQRHPAQPATDGKEQSEQPESPAEDRFLRESSEILRRLSHTVLVVSHDTAAEHEPQAPDIGSGGRRDSGHIIPPRQDEGALSADSATPALSGTAHNSLLVALPQVMIALAQSC